MLSGKLGKPRGTAVRIVRYILLVAMLVAAAFVFYVLATERGTKTAERLVALGFAAGFLLNFFYILRCPRRRPQRINQDW